MYERFTAFLLTLFTLLSSLFSSSPSPQPTSTTHPKTNTITQTILIQIPPYILYLQPVLKSEALNEESIALKIIPNYTQQLSSKTLVKKNNCILGINGGFYDKQKNPLGLLEIKGKQISPRIKSTLFNGFVWYTSYRLNFGPVLPRDLKLSTGFVFQSGPYYNLTTSQPTNSQSYQPKQARRILLAKTGAPSNQLFLIAITDKNNSFSGPTIKELPSILTHHKLAKYKITEIINLDGGSASAFYGFNPDGSPLVIKEFSPIGSLLCFL